MRGGLFYLAFSVFLIVMAIDFMHFTVSAMAAALGVELP